MRDDVFVGVREAVSCALEIEEDQIAPGSVISDFSNWDSIGFLKVIFALFDKFDVELDAAEIVECESIAQICSYIDMQTSSGRANV